MRKIIGILLILIAIISTVILIMISDNQEKNVKKVPCYDKYNNKIQGIVCLQETYDNLSLLFWWAIMTAIIYVTGMILILNFPKGRY